jgi:V8-like Glu-specific endopeptidase
VAVSGVLDAYPLDFSRQELQAIRDVLARTFYRLTDIEDIVLAAGVNPGQIDFSGNAALQWRSVLTVARSRRLIDKLLAVVREREPLVAQRIDELAGPRPVLEPGTGAADDISRPDGAGWRGFNGNEKLVVAGSNTLLGIAFLSTGLVRSRSICRLVVTYASGQEAFGTGSLIGPDLVLTNHHVLYDWEHGGGPATAVEAWFGYEVGTSAEPATVDCDAATIDGDRAQDWAVVRVSPASAPVPAGTPALSLRGAAAPRMDDYVFIIQHPDGGPKMVGLSHNLVRHVDDNVVQYWTDTKAGSSGSPVFNSRWQVVALHHRWIEAPAADGVAYRNQGRRIDRVIDGLTSCGYLVS